MKIVSPIAQKWDIKVGDLGAMPGFPGKTWVGVSRGFDQTETISSPSPLRVSKFSAVVGFECHLKPITLKPVSRMF